MVSTDVVLFIKDSEMLERNNSVLPNSITKHYLNAPFAILILSIASCIIVVKKLFDKLFFFFCGFLFSPIFSIYIKSDRPLDITIIITEIHQRWCLPTKEIDQTIGKMIFFTKNGLGKMAWYMSTQHTMYSLAYSTTIQI
ncbi:hypothetical protein ACJX0J_018211 [Zea mays]